MTQNIRPFAPRIARRLAPWAVLAMLPIAACTSNQNNAADTASPPTAAPLVSAQPASTASSQDQNFIQQAAASDQFEIQSSQMALQNTKNAAVHRFANRMVHDHGQTTQQLQSMASQLGVAMPSSLEPALQEKLTTLNSENGRSFERTYKQAQIAGHQNAIQAFQTEIQQGSDPSVKSFAQQTLPTLRQHLAMARRLP